MEEQRSKLKNSKPKLNGSSKKPAKDEDYETYKVNIRERSNSFKCSTPIVRVTSVRKSLLKIKVNTVAGIVSLFNQSKKSISVDKSPINEKIKSNVPCTESHNESGSSTKSWLDKSTQSQIDDYITYYNKLSSIKQTSVDKDSKMTSEGNEKLEFDSNESTIRRRSQSCNATTIRKPVNILERYKEYPKFKLKHFKYFGVDSREYLTSHGVDVTTITDLEDMPSNESESSTKSRLEKSTQSQIDDYITYYNELSSIKQTSEGNEKLDFDSNESTIRRRSQSCNATTIRKPVNILERYKEYPNFKLKHFKYFGVDSLEYLTSHGVDVTTITDFEDMQTRLPLPSNQNVCVNKIDHTRRRSKSFSGVRVGPKNEITKTEAIAMPKEVSGNDGDREKKFLHTTVVNRRIKSPKMVNMKVNLLDTVPEEPQVKKPPMIKPKHDMNKLPLGSDYIAELKSRLRQSTNATSATKIDQISASHKSDTQKVKDLTKLSTSKTNMDCVKKGLKTCNKIFSSKSDVEKKERK